MKFDRHKHPALCASKIETRYSIDGVALLQHGDRYYLAATDGRKCSLIRAEREEHDEIEPAKVPVYHSGAFTAARKAAGRGKPDACVHLNGRAVVTSADGSSRMEFAQLDARFPDVFGCVPAGDPSFCVSLNAEYLAELAKALGTDNVTLSFFQVDGRQDRLPIRVEPLPLGSASTVDGSFGILMPVAGD
jgi:hypothetical protein